MYLKALSSGGSSTSYQSIHRGFYQGKDRNKLNNSICSLQPFVLADVSVSSFSS